MTAIAYFTAPYGDWAPDKAYTAEVIPDGEGAWEVLNRDATTKEAIDGEMSLSIAEALERIGEMAREAGAQLNLPIKVAWRQCEDALDGEYGWFIDDGVGSYGPWDSEDAAYLAAAEDEYFK